MKDKRMHPIEVLAKRKLKDLPSCNFLGDNESLAENFAEEIELIESEEMIALYQNDLKGDEGRIFITNMGFRMKNDNRWIFILYEDIVTFGLENEDKSGSNENVKLGMKDGSKILVPFSGKNQNIGTYDSFSLIQFLLNVKR